MSVDRDLSIFGHYIALVIPAINLWLDDIAVIIEEKGKKSRVFRMYPIMVVACTYAHGVGLFRTTSIVSSISIYIYI